MNFKEDWPSLLSLLLQCVITWYAGKMSLFALRVEQRARTNIIKEEASIKKTQIWVITIFAIISQVVLFIVQDQADNKLITFIKVENDSLKIENARNTAVLRGHISGETTKIINSASENALNASTNILKSTNQLNQILTGTDEPPQVTFIDGYRLFTIALLNKSVYPVINSTGKAFDFDEMQKCRIAKATNGRIFLDKDCSFKSAQDIYINYLTPKSVLSIYTSSTPTASISRNRFIFSIRIKNTSFLYKVIAYRNNNLIKLLYTVFKLNELDGSTSFFKFGNAESSSIYWDAEFPLAYISAAAGEFDK